MGDGATTGPRGRGRSLAGGGQDRWSAGGQEVCAHHGAMPGAAAQPDGRRVGDARIRPVHLAGSDARGLRLEGRFAVTIRHQAPMSYRKQFRRRRTGLAADGCRTGAGEGRAGAGVCGAFTCLGPMCGPTARGTVCGNFSAPDAD